MKAIVWTGELEVRDDVEVRDPGPHEVVVRIHNAGLCHSDVSVIDGTIPFPTPVVLGHEGAGVVEEVGAAVRKVKVGDHVVLTTLGNCGQCDACDRGQPTHCRDTFGKLPAPFTVGGEQAFQFANAGVFSEYTVVGRDPGRRHRPSRCRSTSACLIGCAVVTGTGAVLNRAKVQTGPDGRRSSAPAASASRSSRRPACRPRPPHRRDRRQPGQGGGRPPVRRHRLHRRLGTVDDTVAAVKDLGFPNGVDYAFECVGHPALIRNAIDMLDWGGTCVLLGVPKLGTEASFVVQHDVQRQVDPRLPLRLDPSAPRHPAARPALPRRRSSSSTRW